MKNKTFFLVVALTCMIATLKLQAQDKPLNIKEIGFGLTSLNSFSLQYRWGNEHRLFRFSGNLGIGTSTGKTTDEVNYEPDGTLSENTTKTTSPVSLDFGISFSILKTKSISEKFGCLFGGIFTLGYSIDQENSTEDNDGTTYPYSPYTIKTKDNEQTFRPAAGLALGAFYKISPSFLLYAEIDPQIYFAYRITTSDQTTTTTYTDFISIKTEKLKNTTSTVGLTSLTNSGASITIVYRFPK